jgi:hypothetical protein
LRIADCGLGILSTGCPNGRYDNRKDFIHFDNEVAQKFSSDVTELRDYLEPIEGLVCLLFTDAKLRAKLSVAPRAAGSTVIRSDGSSTS